jgi:hypothetical protein
MTDGELKPKHVVTSILTVGALITIFAFIVVITVPNYINGDRSPVRPCQANLRLIQGAKATWALDNDKKETAMPAEADLFGPTKYASEKPACPLGGVYTLGLISEKPRCSISSHKI